MWKTGTALLLAFALGACSTLKTGSTCVVEDDYFVAHRVLEWAPDYGRISRDPLDAIAPVTLERIRMEIERQFAMLGFEFTDTSVADLQVSFVVATRQEISDGSYAYHDPYWWGVYQRPVLMPGLQTYKEAYLAIDLLEAESKRPLWRGWAEKLVSDSDRNDPEPLIREAIASILAELPGAVRPVQ